MFEFKKEQIVPMLEGMTILGTGGGGEAEWGRVILENEFARNRKIMVANQEDIEDDAFVCSGGIMGSVKSLENISYEETTLGWETFSPLCEAIELMQKLEGRNVDYLIPFEAGGLNTPVIMAAAARFGIPVIDGDGNGRATPETQMTSFIGLGIDLYPMPIVDRIGNASIVYHSESPTYADELGRQIVVKGGGSAANAHYPMSGKEVKETMIPNTISRAIEISSKLEEARKNDKKIVPALEAVLGGREIFSGFVSSLDAVNKGGFYLTQLVLQGNGNYKGDIGKLVIKNETMVFWLNEKLVIMLPDLAFMINPETGAGIPSIDLEPGKELTLIGAPCHPRIKASFNSNRGRIAFGPERYGYPELEYLPFE